MRRRAGPARSPRSIQPPDQAVVDHSRGRLRTRGEKRSGARAWSRRACHLGARPRWPGCPAPCPRVSSPPRLGHTEAPAVRFDFPVAEFGANWSRLALNPDRLRVMVLRQRWLIIARSPWPATTRPSSARCQFAGARPGVPRPACLPFHPSPTRPPCSLLINPHSAHGRPESTRGGLQRHILHARRKDTMMAQPTQHRRFSTVGCTARKWKS